MTTNLTHHTDTDAPAHESAKRIIASTLSREARGREHAIPSRELAERTPVSASTVRDLIKEVRRTYQLPIGNCQSGYFIIASRAEYRRQVERQLRQAETSRQTARDISASWHTSNGGAP